MKGPVYLDYNSTTPVDKEVLEKMLPYFSEKFGNPASVTHQFGWTAKAAVDKARESVAKMLNCEPSEIVFTSGSTEGINLALKGIFHNYSSKGNHIVACADEHKAVLDTLRSLEKKGAEITILPVDRNGNIDLSQLEKSITGKTLVVSCMTANNETGVIHPVEEIARITREKGCIFFSDATQAPGKIKIDTLSGADVISVSAHKMYGPKGCGALFLRRRNPRVVPEPLIHGGGHEKGMRSGTLNVPGIAGLGKAAEIVTEKFEEDHQRMFTLRNKLESALKELGAKVNGGNASRLPNVSNVFFPGTASERLITKIRSVAVSTGSACTSAVQEPSHVLTGMGLSTEDCYSSIRFSLGRFTTEEEIDFVIERYSEVIRQI